MSLGHILVIDDEIDITNLLKIFFGNQGYVIDTANRGQLGIDLATKKHPSVIILDIHLPDMTGYDVAKILRDQTSTKHIPIIFLTQRDERNHRLASLETGADDFITKPFDIELLQLKIKNIINRSQNQKHAHGVSSLPTGARIEEHLASVMHRDDDWAYIDMKIKNFDEFQDVYGWSSADDVIRYAAELIHDVLHEHGTMDDFIGHPDQNQFVIISHLEEAETLIAEVQTKFNKDIKQHYSFKDREQGHMLMTKGDDKVQVDLMELAIGWISTKDHKFADIRELMEMAAQKRRGEDISEHYSSDIDSAW